MSTIPLNARADVAASAEIRDVDGRKIVWFRIAGGKHHGAIGVSGATSADEDQELAVIGAEAATEAAISNLRVEA